MTVGGVFRLALEEYEKGKEKNLIPLNILIFIMLIDGMEYVYVVPSQAFK